MTEIKQRESVQFSGESALGEVLYFHCVKHDLVRGPLSQWRESGPNVSRIGLMAVLHVAPYTWDSVSIALHAFNTASSLLSPGQLVFSPLALIQPSS